jgi:hypothetical protein
MAKKEIDFKAPEIVELENKIRREEKLRRKAIVDQVLRFLGLILATFIFFVTLSVFAPLTLFAGLFGYGEAKDAWRAMDVNGNLFVFGGDSIYAAITGGDPTIAVWLTTLIQIGLGVGVGFLFAYYVRDVLGVARSFFGIGKVLISELRETVVENVSTVGPDGKKTLFGSKKEDPKKDNSKKPSKTDKLQAELQKLQAEGSSAQAPEQTQVAQTPVSELDKALTEPNAQAQKPQPDPFSDRQRRSPFDKK